jgi:glutathione S-transferase
MITLYGTLSAFGLPETSSFVSKARVLLKMADVPHQLAKGDFQKAPKGKIPYIDDAGQLLGDSTFIRWHLEQKYGVDFDKGLSAADKAVAWSFEKMADEHLYWAIVYARWMNPDNFAKVSKVIFADIPPLLRPVLIPVIKKKVRANIMGHGMGRHTADEVWRLAAADLKAISDQLGDKPWLMGKEPCGADAAVWSTVLGCLCPYFETPLRTATEQHPNLQAYAGRGLERWFPEFQRSV